MGQTFDGENVAVHRRKTYLLSTWDFHMVIDRSIEPFAARSAVVRTRSVALLANKRSANRPNLQGPRRFTTKDDKKKERNSTKNRESTDF